MNECAGCLLQVEKAPVVIKAGVSKAEAEEMQKKVEAGKHPCPCIALYCIILYCISSVSCHKAGKHPLSMQVASAMTVGASLFGAQQGLSMLIALSSRHVCKHGLLFSLLVCLLHAWCCMCLHAPAWMHTFKMQHDLEHVA